MKDSICAHVMVKNEDIFVYYSIMSVLNEVDRVLVYDTGSVDNTIKILDYLENTYEKITVKKMSLNSRKEIGIARQKMIDETEEDWILVLDGDEVWYENSLKLLKDLAFVSEKKSFAVNYRNFIGTLDYVLPVENELYKINGKVGSHTIKLIRNNSSLTSGGDFGVETYFIDGVAVADHHDTYLFDSCLSFCHMSFMQRTTNKLTYLKSIYRFRKMFTKSDFCKRNFSLPAVFSLPVPSAVPGSYYSSFSWKLISFLGRKICRLIK